MQVEGEDCELELDSALVVCCLMSWDLARRSCSMQMSSSKFFSQTIRSSSNADKVGSLSILCLPIVPNLPPVGTGIFVGFLLLFSKSLSVDQDLKVTVVAYFEQF